MPLNPTYSVGTVTVSAGSAVVTGVGMLFIASGVRPGDVFERAGLSITIASIDSNTQITLVKPWPGSPGSGDYEIRYTPDAARVMGAAREVVGSLEGYAQLIEESREPPFAPFSSYSDALGAVIPETVRRVSWIDGGKEVVAVRQIGGTLLRGGWATGAEPHIDLHPSVADFEAAATAAGKSYPTPAITRFDLPPQKINIMEVGVIPSNAASDAANNRGAIQAVIDWLTARTNGGTISGGAFSPRYSNPIITLDAPLILKPKVHFDFDRSVRFRASSAMVSMVDTAVGTANRLRGLSILGGTWDAGRLAERCFNFREFEDINFGGDNMELRAASRSALSLGDPARSVNNFGFYPSRLKIINSNASYGFGAVAAIEVVHGISDCNFDRLLLVGYPKGVTGPLFISRAYGCHAWSFPDTQGPLLVGFECNGGQNVYSAMQVDNPFEAAFRLNGGDNYRFIGCTSTFDFANITVVSPPAPNTVPIFDLGTGRKRVLIDNAFGNDRADTFYSGMVAGDISNATVRDSYHRFNPARLEVVRGWTTTAASINTIVGAAPTVVSSDNIASVTRNADADYTFAMTRAQPSVNYVISVTAIPVSYPQILIPVIRTQANNSFRVQTVDAAGAFVRPLGLKVSIRPMG